MYNYSSTLIKKYFEEHSLVASDIESFNNFIDVELHNIIKENEIIEPTIIPENIDDLWVANCYSCHKRSLFRDSPPTGQNQATGLRLPR